MHAGIDFGMDVSLCGRPRLGLVFGGFCHRYTIGPLTAGVSLVC